jgi:hypothetical protein
MPSLTPPANRTPFNSLLQPRSYASSHSHMSGARHTPVMHSQDTIRDSTMQLSNMSFSGPPEHPASFQVLEPLARSHEQKSSDEEDGNDRPSTSAKTIGVFDQNIDMVSPFPTLANNEGLEGSNRRDTFSSVFRPSGLSLLLGRGSRYAQADENYSSHLTELDPDDIVPTSQLSGLPPSLISQTARGSGDPPDVARISQERIHIPPCGNDSETVPLLGSSHPSYTPPLDIQPKSRRRTEILKNVSNHILTALKPDSFKHNLALAIKSIPSVLLGSLLNILDGVSCKGSLVCTLINHSNRLFL